MSDKKKEKKEPTVLQGSLVNHDPAEDSYCGSDMNELAEFIRADEPPILASEEFKNTLREKLWRMVKDKYHLLIAVSVLLSS
jgi:hypothetical protein